MTTTTFPPNTQETMLLNAFAYVDEYATHGESAAQQAQRMGQDIAALMANEPRLAQWQIVWGPALDTARANMLYVAGNLASNTYAVVVRGSAWSFFLDWLEDFTVLLPFVPCADIANIPIAVGTSLGLATLLHGLHASNGTDVLSFLATVPADAQVYVTGHSLGGCLASVLAVAVANTIGKQNVKVYTFAAPSAGGSAFGAAFNGMFDPSAAFRFYNDLDMVPNAWATLQTIETYYQGFVACPEDIQTIITHVIQSDKNTYVQVGTPIVLAGSVVQPNGINPTADALFLWQAAQQHCKWTYCGLVGATRAQLAATKVKRIAATMRAQTNQPAPREATDDTGVFLVSYHGGTASAPYNNLYAYDSHGNQLSAHVLQAQPGTHLSELRGVYRHGDYLYVVNGGKAESQVLCFSGAHTTYTQQPGVFIGSTEANSVKHPFALAFNATTCFVSNQDTNVVALFSVTSPTTTTVIPGAAASYLRGFDATNIFLDGTFVASSNGALPHVPPTTPVPGEQGGLAVTITNGKVQHSVRDIVLAGPNNPPTPLLLYVADEAGNCVRVYDPVSGSPCGMSTAVPGPTHLLTYNGSLYVSAGNQLFSGPLVTQVGKSATDVCLDLRPVPVVLPPKIDPAKAAFAGMTVDESGNFYLALRTNRKIVKFAQGDFSQPSLWLKCPKGAQPEYVRYYHDG